MATLTRTPSGETIEKVRSLLRKMDGNPKMRKAVAAAIKAMGLPDPLPVTQESAANQKAKPNG